MRDRRWVIPAALVIGLLVFELALSWLGSPREEILAINGLLLFLAWLAIVFISVTPLARKVWYRLLFKTNDRRWCWLAALSFVFFISCAVMGPGQPMIRSLEESPHYPQAEYVAKAIGKAFWNLLQLEDYQKALKLDSMPPPREEKKKPERPFYGLRSWSHWFVFIFLYLPTLFFYGIAAKREEVAAWAERRLQAREERLKQQPQQSSAPGNVPLTVGRLLVMQAILDFIAIIVGTVAAHRIIRWMERRKV